MNGRGLTLAELRRRGSRVTVEMLEESAAAGLLVEQDGAWCWTAAAEEAFGAAFAALAPEAPTP